VALWGTPQTIESLRGEGSSADRLQSTEYVDYIVIDPNNDAEPDPGCLFRTCFIGFTKHRCTKHSFTYAETKYVYGKVKSGVKSYLEMWQEGWHIVCFFLVSFCSSLCIP